MSKPVRAGITAVCAASISPICFWLSGYDFNERGSLALLCFVTALGLAVIAATYPGFWWGDK